MEELTEIGPELWVHNGELRIAGMKLGHRMTVARRENGKLWVHSPSKLTRKLGEALDELGEIEILVAPNDFHDLFWPDYFVRYPKARFVSPPGMLRGHPRWDFEEALTPESASAAPLWPEEFDQVFIGGMPKMNETVFVHRPSGTLIVADLLFYFPKGSIRGWTKFAMELNAAYGRATPSRLFRMLIKDRGALRESMDRVLALEFDRIVVGHGELVTDHARERLRKGYEFLSG